MNEMVYTVIQVRALQSLHEMIEATDQMEPGPQARVRARLRATIGRRLIRLGKLLVEPAGAQPRQQTQSV